MTAHVICLAQRFLKEGGEMDFCVPVDGQCPSCSNKLMWKDLIRYQESPQDYIDNDSECDHWTEALKQ